MPEPIVRRLICAFGFMAACGGTSGAGVDAPGEELDAGPVDAGPVDASPVDASPVDASGNVAMDDFERGTLGPDWTIVFPPPPNDRGATCDPIRRGRSEAVLARFTTR